MSAEEKILGGIISEAESGAKAVAEKATAEIEKIEAAAAAEAKSYSGEVVSAALLKAKAIKLNAESAADLKVRDAKLAKKHEEIEKTLGMAAEVICALDDEKYFALLSGVAAGYAKDQEGTLFVGSKDIKRDLSIFKTALQNKGIKVNISDVPLEEERGFVLKYGDIEYNLSLTAIINDKRDSLEDRIHQILFG